MRLIDADELKKAFPNNADWEYPVNTNERVCEIIDNAPTVESDYERGYSEGVHDTERPQGEWKHIVEEDNDVECPFCGFQEDGVYYNFCPQCGARMKGGAE